MTAYKVSLACPVFLDDLRRLSAKHSQLKQQVKNKLELLTRGDPIELGTRLKRAPLCFKIRVTSDFRMIYMLKGAAIVPIMLYAKNETEDVALRQILQAIEMIRSPRRG